jgi:hypothetical protein
MNSKDLRQALVASTIDQLGHLGFVAKSASDHVRFERKVAYGQQVAYYNIVSFGESYRLSLVLVVFHQVVEVVHGLALGLKKKSIDIRGTVNLVADAYNGQPLQHFAVETAEDVQRWCDFAATYIAEAGMQQLDAYGELAVLDKLFNSQPAVELPVCPYMLSRAEKGIIIAKILSNPNLLRLIETYRSILTEQDILLTYEEVVEFLDRYQPDELWRLKV